MRDVREKTVERSIRSPKRTPKAKHVKDRQLRQARASKSKLLPHFYLAIDRGANRPSIRDFDGRVCAYSSSTLSLVKNADARKLICPRTCMEVGFNQFMAIKPMCPNICS